MASLRDQLEREREEVAAALVPRSEPTPVPRVDKIGDEYPANLVNAVRHLRDDAEAESDDTYRGHLRC